jgi:hypothetical protein
MSYSLVYDDNNEPGKLLGRSVLIANLPKESEVVIFYYPGSTSYAALEEELENIGENKFEKRVFVNIGKIGDDNQSWIDALFKIEDVPLIIITAIDSLAAIRGEDGKKSTLYVKLDKKVLLKNTARTIDMTLKLVNLFLSRRISEAMKYATRSERSALLLAVAEKVGGVLGRIEEISINFAPVGLSIKFRGDS